MGDIVVVGGYDGEDVGEIEGDLFMGSGVISKVGDFEIVGENVG